MKNLNSFRAVERSIEHEIERQRELLAKGERVVQETRGWDEVKQQTFSQRRKEESHDYRYFPDPDLPQLILRALSPCTPDELRKEMPELPSARRARFTRAFGLKSEEAEVLVVNRALGVFFEEAARALPTQRLIALAANYTISDLTGLIKRRGTDADTQTLPFAPAAFAELIRMTAEGELSSRGAKDVLAVLCEKGGSPRDIAHERGLLQRSDAQELEKVARAAIVAHPKVAADFKAGKAAALQFLVGQGMKATKGAAHPELLRSVFERLLA